MTMAGSQRRRRLAAPNLVHSEAGGNLGGRSTHSSGTMTLPVQQEELFLAHAGGTRRRRLTRLAR